MHSEDLRGRVSKSYWIIASNSRDTHKVDCDILAIHVSKHIELWAQSAS
jgi:hypothetical protein